MSRDQQTRLIIHKNRIDDLHPNDVIANGGYAKRIRINQDQTDFEKYLDTIGEVTTAKSTSLIKGPRKPKTAEETTGQRYGINTLKIMKDSDK